MADALLKDLTTHETQGVQFAVLQRWLKQVATNVGATNPGTDPLLRDLTVNETQGAQFAVLQRWAKLIAQKVSN